MKRYRIVFLLATLMIFWLISGVVSAQIAPDADRDGVPDKSDRCPTVPGPASNNGCPVTTTNTQPPQEPTPNHPPGDSDGDGTLDVNDKCPLDGGPDWNNGCPTDLTAPPQTAPQITLPTMPTSGECMIATMGQSRVNLRAMPAVTAAIIAVLNPANLYPALATSTDSAGGLWYLVKTGWASGQVVRTGGDCGKIPGLNFGGVTLNFIDGPGNGLTLNFIPIPGGNPFVKLFPFGSDKMSLNFTKLADEFPNQGFSFYLTPFPGSGGGKPPASPAAPGSDVFDDGFLRSQMGDGSVFLAMPHAGDNPLQGILIGLDKPDVDPYHILIGMLLPAVQTGGSKTYGILIGLLLPAVQTGDSHNQGILIGLLLPAVQTGELNPPTDKIGFNFNGDNNAHGSGGGGGSGKQPKSIQELLDMGLNFLVPGADAASLNFDSPGWGVVIEGALVPAV